MVSPPPVGLYSIGVREPDVGRFLAAAASWQVPFVHLRGGPRGYDLARIPGAPLATWARQARDAGIAVTVVTADTDLADFTRPGSPRYAACARELALLAGAASQLGARAVRLLARSVPAAAQWDTLLLPAVPDMTVLAELHHPGWFTLAMAARLRALLDRTPGLALLLDSAQVHYAWLAAPGAPWPTLLAGLAARTAVIHLSDRGSGLDHPGHQLLSAAVRAVAAGGHQPEVAFEWTGADRSPQACLTRYRAATAWHTAQWEERPVIANDPPWLSPSAPPRRRLTSPGER